VSLLVARLALARSRNRLGNIGRRRAPPGERGATGRKTGGGQLLLGFMALVFAWQTVSTTGLLVQRVSRLAEQRQQPAAVLLDDVTFTLLELAAAQEVGADHALNAEGQALLDRAAERRAEGSSASAAAAREQQIRQTFAREGIAGFRPSVIPERRLWPSSELWYADTAPLELLKPLAVVAFLLALAQVLQHVAGSDEDLARVGPNLEWLFSFPVRARDLFLARALAAPFASPLVWVVLFPFYAVVFGCAGLGLASLVLGAAAAIYVALWGGGLRVLLETTLRRALSVIWVSRLQAILLTFSLLPLAAGYAVAFSPVTAGLLDWAGSRPNALLYEPLTLPLSLAAGGARAALGVGLGLGALAAWIAACVAIAERMVRDGVATGGAEFRVVRGGADGAVGRPATLLRGVRLKEWRSLLRDRRTRAQAFIAPLLLLSMQFLLNPSLAHAISDNPRHAATAAFAVSAFSLTTSAFTALAAEGPALYWLYTVPVDLKHALIDKLWVRGLLSAGFALLVFLVTWVTSPASFLSSLPYAALALAGIALYSVIALGIGTLGTDPLEPEPRRRVRPGGMYLFMLLAALYAHAIYTPSLWTKVVQLALSALLAYAVWQKLGQRLPFLLDPTEAPPPAITVADGVTAALGFFVLSALLALPFGNGEHTPALALLVSTAGAGSLVAALALLAFRRNRIPDMWRALGLRRPGGVGPSAPRALALGLVAGGAAAALSLGYSALARRIPGLAEGLDAAQLSLAQLDRDARLWLLALSVLAAPLFEELIFRGILYRGFRHSLGPGLSALASALVFALVHPAATALPVFVMAWLAASVYERTRWLATPVAAHMTYNAVVFGSALMR
jgi:membrane protease YdiL (CAAX protease family)